MLATIGFSLQGRQGNATTNLSCNGEAAIKLPAFGARPKLTPQFKCKLIGGFAWKKRLKGYIHNKASVI